MKQIVLKVPDQKLSFFMELINSLGFEVVKQADIDIPEEHKEIVRKRKKKSDEDPQRLVDWPDVKDNFKLADDLQNKT